MCFKWLVNQRNSITVPWLLFCMIVFIFWFPPTSFGKNCYVHNKRNGPHPNKSKHFAMLRQKNQNPYMINHKLVAPVFLQAQPVSHSQCPTLIRVDILLEMLMKIFLLFFVMRLLTGCQVIIMSFKNVNLQFDPILICTVPGLIFKDGVFLMRVRN